MTGVDKVSLPPGRVEVDPRAGGIARLVTGRQVRVVCETCGRTFVSTGTGASHARATRHVVACTYNIQFRFCPTVQPPTYGSAGTS